MSSLVVQIGQCGNQIGEEFWKIVDKNLSTSTNRHVYTHWDGFVRSVHIDSEPKVVRKVISSGLKVRDSNVILSKRGRGNNFAQGYHGTKDDREDQILQQAMEAIRKEVERCSSFAGIIVLHSMSGGTGSGLGSRVVECLREEYGAQYLLSCVVAPHASGDSPLQHYNALLCLATLQRQTDGIILLQNDEVLQRLEKRYDAGSAVSMSQINSHMAASLAGLVLPTHTLASNSGVSVGLEPWDLIRSVCPTPATKLLHTNHVTRSRVSWEQLACLLLQSVPRYSPHGGATVSLQSVPRYSPHGGATYRSMGNLLVARGDTNNSFLAAQAKVEAKVRQTYSCVDWNPFPIEVWTASTPLNGPQSAAASISSVANYSSCCDALTQLADRGWGKFQAGAYLHWYYKYGADKSDFEEAFETVQQIVDDYREAVAP